VRGAALTSAILADVSFTVFRQGELEWVPRDDGSGRTVAGLSEAMTQSRANLWRYPPGARGKRHLDRGQEEVFVVLDGTLTVDLGDPPERHEVPRGGAIVVQPGTILQLRNLGSDELVLFIYGAPPVRGQGEFFEDVPD
jgi:mannose-6-phosphate isomerase-like protein (cupin superfamily)